MVSKGAKIPKDDTPTLKHNTSEIFLIEDAFENSDTNFEVKASKEYGGNASFLNVTDEATENNAFATVIRNTKIHNDVATLSKEEMVKSVIGADATTVAATFRRTQDLSEYVNNKDVAEGHSKDFIPKVESRNCPELPITSVIESNLKVCLPIPNTNCVAVVERSTVLNEKKDGMCSVSERTLTLPKRSTKDDRVVVFTIPNEDLGCRKNSDSDGTNIVEDSTNTASFHLLGEMNSSDSSKAENMALPLNQNTTVTTSETRNWGNIIKEPFTKILNFSKFKRFFKKKDLKAKLKTSASLTSSNTSFSSESQVSSQTVPEEYAEKFWTLLDEWRSKKSEVIVSSSDMVEQWLSKDLRTCSEQ